MLVDTTAVSRWYAIHKGFRISEVCYGCKGENLLHHKVKEGKFEGILSRCSDCEKIMPVRMREARKSSWKRAS